MYGGIESTSTVWTIRKNARPVMCATYVAAYAAHIEIVTVKHFVRIIFRCLKLTGWGDLSLTPFENQLKALIA